LRHAGCSRFASQFFASLADKEALKARFIEKWDVVRRMAREALEEDSNPSIAAITNANYQNAVSAGDTVSV
jgi:hypothetical protein